MSCVNTPITLRFKKNGLKNATCKQSFKAKASGVKRVKLNGTDTGYQLKPDYFSLLLFVRHDVEQVQDDSRRQRGKRSCSPKI